LAAAFVGAATSPPGLHQDRPCCRRVRSLREQLRAAKARIASMEAMLLDDEVFEEETQL